MGDESGEGQSQESYGADGGVAQQQSAGDESQGGGDDGTDPEATLTRLGQLFSNGEYGEAAHLAQQFRNSQDDTSPYYGRAWYGLVMCYDRNNQITQAGTEMANFVKWAQRQGHDVTLYNQQLLSYQQGQPWHGDFLLY